MGVMLSGDEFYDDEVTSGLLDPVSSGGPHNDIEPHECHCDDCAQPDCVHETVEKHRLGFELWACPDCGQDFTLQPFDLRRKTP